MQSIAVRHLQMPEPPGPPFQSNHVLRGAVCAG